MRLTNQKTGFWHALFMLLLLASVACHRDLKQASAKERIQQTEEQLDSLNAALGLLDDTIAPSVVISLYEKAIRLATEVPDTSKNKFFTFFGLTLKLNPIGAYRENLRIGWQTVRLWDEVFGADEYLNLRFILYGSMAGSYSKLGKGDSALYMYRLAVKEATESKNILYIAGTKNNLGVFYYRFRQLDSAMHYFREADQLIAHNEHTDPDLAFLHGSVRDNIAEIYEENTDYEAARHLYEENYGYYSYKQDAYRYINAGLSLANMHVALRDFSMAEALLEKLKAIQDTANFEGKIDHSIFYHEVCRKYYTAIGQYNLAETHQNQWLTLLNERNLQKENKLIETATALAQYANKQHAENLAYEQEVKQNLKNKNFLQLVISILLFIGVATGLVYFIFYYRHKSRIASLDREILESQKVIAEQALREKTQEKKMTELELQHKKKDLAQMALYLQDKQEWSDNIYRSVKQLEALKGVKRSNAIKELKLEIRDQTRAKSEIEMLQNNIESLSSAFYEALRNNYPQLTKTDLKICGYIRLNLSNAEIAQIQNIAPASVKVIRHRLRKKFDLNASTNLDAFITSL